LRKLHLIFITLIIFTSIGLIPNVATNGNAEIPPEFYSLHEKWINYDENEFSRITSELIGNETDDLTKAKKIAEMEIELMTHYSGLNSTHEKYFQYQGREYWAVYSNDHFVSIKQAFATPSWVILTHYGNCEEYAILFDALAMSINLTTRIVGAPNQTHEWNFVHKWNEVQINSKWVYVDTSWWLQFNNKTIGDRIEYFNATNHSYSKVIVVDTKEDITTAYTGKADETMFWPIILIILVAGVMVFVLLLSWKRSGLQFDRWSFSSWIIATILLMLLCVILIELIRLENFTAIYVIGTVFVAIGVHYFSVGNTAFSCAASLRHIKSSNQRLIKDARYITFFAAVIVASGIFILSFGLLSSSSNGFPWLSSNNDIVKNMVIGGGHYVLDRLIRSSL